MYQDIGKALVAFLGDKYPGFTESALGSACIIDPNGTLDVTRLSRLLGVPAPDLAEELKSVLANSENTVGVTVVWKPIVVKKSVWGAVGGHPEITRKLKYHDLPLQDKIKLCSSLDESGIRYSLPRTGWRSRLSAWWFRLRNYKILRIMRKAPFTGKPTEEQLQFEKLHGKRTVLGVTVTKQNWIDAGRQVIDEQ